METPICLCPERALGLVQHRPLSSGVLAAIIHLYFWLNSNFISILFMKIRQKTLFHYG